MRAGVPAIVLGIAMALPTLVFFLLTVADRNNAYLQSASVVFFLVPLALLGARAHFDLARLRHGFLLLFLLTTPLWVSIFAHLPEYEFVNLGTAVIRTTALSIYLLTMIFLSVQPDATRIFRIALMTMAIAFIVLIVSGSVLLPEWHYRRFTPAGIHPNWWGELSVALAFGASFFNTRWQRYSLWFAALAMAILVQNRSAIGHILLIVSFATLAHEGFRRLLVIGLTTVFLIAPVIFLLDLVLVDGSLFQPLIDWVVNSVLLLNDPVRGVSSGFTNRDTGWLYALGVFSEHPWTGIGFSRSNAILHDDVSAQIHNGHLALMADLGMIGYAVLAVLMVGAVVRIARRGDFILFGYTAGFVFFNMMFIPRAINLSVLPMLFWMIVILAWLPRPADEREPAGAPSDTPPGQPPAARHPAARIGERWARGGGGMAAAVPAVAVAAARAPRRPAPPQSAPPPPAPRPRRPAIAAVLSTPAALAPNPLASSRSRDASS
jgi:hypothetical protein